MTDRIASFCKFPYCGQRYLRSFISIDRIHLHIVVIRKGPQELVYFIIDCWARLRTPTHPCSTLHTHIFVCCYYLLVGGLSRPYRSLLAEFISGRKNKPSRTTLVVDVNNDKVCFLGCRQKYIIIAAAGASKTQCRRCTNGFIQYRLPVYTRKSIVVGSPNICGNPIVVYRRQQISTLTEIPLLGSLIYAPQS